ncbi:hypothetical protein [Terrisporobacter mayombei]|uniref:Uncharacterized protein n=1 Tax=Terrisporobacter mayombei TaxID=1541 RepID=A0ABY9PYD0_9FIRM|nr:hypothetical protein [Terrisporobacter mayombei]MCC3868531.1 hypothetical protein [Terrisporobacter mayombei]WMT80688.1 hypothetical protein TEMA_10090 [Terrisporobacter mayombei]
MISNVISGKVRSIKVSDYFEYRKCEYCFAELIVTKSNRNNNTEQIATLINSMFKKTNKLIYQANKKIILEEMPKASFYIHIEKHSVKFFFIIPKIHLNKFKAKFKDCWKNIEIKIVDEMPIVVNICTKFDVHYEKEDGLSIAVDKRNNDLLNSNMSIVNILEENESCGILYNFIPVSEKESNYFRAITYKETLNKFENGENLKKSKKTKDYVVISLKIFIRLINDLIDSLLSTSQNNRNTFNPMKIEASYSTKRKAHKEICKSQIILLTKSSKKERENELGRILGNTFESVEDNNRLIVTKITKNVDLKKTVIKNVSINKTTVEECSNFINMPSTDVIKQFNMIEHNKVLELKAPKCLDNGEIRIGKVKNKENTQEVYYSTDEQMKRMSRVLMGSQGAGKDYYMGNLSEDIIKANRSLFVIDYIDECQLADDIKKRVPKEKLIEINSNRDDELQAFLINELTYKLDDSLDVKIEVSMQKAQQFELLLDTINDVKSELSPRMLRYLYCAGTVAFYNNVNSSFKEIINILKNPDYRTNIINNLDKEGKIELSEEIEDLRELDKADKKGNVENYDSKIDGILDRVAKLKSASFYTKKAFMKDGSNNIDFVKAMNERKVILIKIPHKSFKTKMLKDLMCTFYLQKIWIAKQEADKNIQTEVFINELHQCPHAQLLLEDILVEHRKYNLTFTLAMHYLDQLTAKCKKSLLSSGASFILISGCDPEAYKGLSVYFEKDGYTETDLTELERYHALCLIKNEDDGYSSFICKLPS